MEIIPAIDIIDGKCVRLTKGDFNRKTVYRENPVEVAKEFEKNGIKRLHLVDLDGARSKRVVNLEVLRSITDATQLEVDFGGGVQSTADLQRVFDAGAKMVTGGSIAVKNPTLFEQWITDFGSERIILGADVSNGKIAISGWQEQSRWDLDDFLKQFLRIGIQQVICTDVSKDGLLQGPSITLYRRLVEQYPGLKIIASGGVSEVNDLIELESSGVAGAIVGKAIYEGRITLDQLSEF